SPSSTELHPSALYTLSLHDALPISAGAGAADARAGNQGEGAGSDQRRPGPPRRAHLLGPMSPVAVGHLFRRDAAGHRLLRRNRRSEEHTSELQSPYDLVCRLLLEKK